ncbi:FAD-dependent oxidoreductase [Gordonia humi]|uniref:ferredoxin--NADP(+) reductase n=1 Tax=Gordonia humi TaxID=686429 RepID=A0A840EUS7_9ACTN|nr:FAD-dependent oxidoreductase [Gordonia humi]MBB4134104.1 ferredoxin--NADP+ reductase [Gordonia humi]
MDKARVAVIGAGPGGLFAAEELSRASKVAVEVDLFDRLPTPYGLVRYGVAPDHPRIKSVIRGFEGILENPTVRFLGHVEYGSDIDLDWLSRHYDAVVFSTGAANARKMGIAGEEFDGSIAATQLVSWYSGHPDSSFEPRLSGSAVAVVGAGNVALDVTRILTKSVDELAATDMPDEVLAVLRGSGVREVHVVCRRGPEHAKFTTKELRELRDLDEVDVIIDPADLSRIDETDLPRATIANLKVFREMAHAVRRPDHKTVHLHFWRKPVEITGETQVTGLRVERTVPDADGAVIGTGEREHLPVQLVIRSVGYRSDPLPELPFDSHRGVVPNRDGRVLDTGGKVIPFTYVAGWLKRGPSGVIGTNRMCSEQTVEQIVDDLAAAEPRRSADAVTVNQSLRERTVCVVDYEGWRRINATEIERGSQSGRERVKVTDWPSLRAVGVGVPQ